MNKHTPGPWTFGHWGNDFWVGTNSAGLSGKVAKVIWDMGEEVAEGRENARLIAAAPELLEALKVITDHFEARMADNENATWYDSYNNACAAIAKAEGRQ